MNTQIMTLEALLRRAKRETSVGRRQATSSHSSASRTKPGARAVREAWPLGSWCVPQNFVFPQPSGNLLPTLRTFLASGMSVTTTAKELQVHVHTVQYRLAKIEELSGLSPRKCEERLIRGTFAADQRPGRCRWRRAGWPPSERL
jgi:sugar diacid utilization regulator